MTCCRTQGEERASAAAFSYDVGAAFGLTSPWPLMEWPGIIVLVMKTMVEMVEDSTARRVDGWKE